ncbi:DMT family transporter [Cognatishimia maritima]|uniref:Permease of the drug/metabolite transporter (DMT) superfamily n=1 Tax=Cognatishimia maritima TaxID=870908 RepID=A0A1M5N5L9_9RHOB|nr:DMT family transporter [Cognatishimia maritima]SHG84459.1 Permease of the drug/metabolite transporter (DMT) superfamily [Cognatishimia maritima]
MTQTNNTKAALLSLAAFSVYASHDVIVRYLGGIYAPMQVLFFASLLSFPLLTLMIIGRGKRTDLRPHHPWWVAARSISMVGGGTCGFYAFSVLPMTQVYAILFTVPLLITVMSIPMLGERVGVHRAAAVVLGLIGVLIVVRPGAEPLSLGHIAGFSAALFSAFQSVIARKIGNKESQVVMMLYPFLAILVTMGAALAFVYKPMPLIDFAAIGAVAVMGFFATFLLIGAYRAGEAAIVAPMQYSQIIWATIFGLIFFAETPDRQTLIGAGVIILSGVYIVLREALSGNSANTPVLRTRSRAIAPGAFRISQFLKLRNGHDEE